jgi:hypothetical protein
MDSRGEPCIGLLRGGCEPTILDDLGKNDAERTHVHLTIESRIGDVIIKSGRG